MGLGGAGGGFTGRGGGGQIGVGQARMNSQNPPQLPQAPTPRLPGYQNPLGGGSNGRQNAPRQSAQQQAQALSPWGGGPPPNAQALNFAGRPNPWGGGAAPNSMARAPWAWAFDRYSPQYGKATPQQIEQTRQSVWRG